MAPSGTQALPSPLDMGAGLYVHVPFCRAKCTYCDFASIPGGEPLWHPYLQVLLDEIAALPPLRPCTLYVGGGTPTVWPAEDLAQIVAAAREVGLPPDAEVTVEANPGTVDRDTLEGLRAAGYNRLSLGVQSTAGANLRLLGRIHSFAQAREAMRQARAAGFTNVSIDLIYGLPGQTLEHWQADLATALELGSEHLSAYCLSLEEGTPLAQSVAAGRLPEPDPDLAADMYLATREALATAGYVHYEISNWARCLSTGPGSPAAPLTSTHNLIYWRNEPYMGIGSGAHSSLMGWRFARLSDPADYVASHPAQRVCFSEAISRELTIAETAILALRRVSGFSRAWFIHRTGVDPMDHFADALSWARTHRLLDDSSGHFRLTERGLLLSDEVFQRFLPG